MRDGRVFEHIIIVIDRLLKKKKFVALDFLKIKVVIKAFIEWIWQEKGYLKRVMLDRGIQFILHFWKRFCERIGIKPKMLITFYPKTDG
jgi:hypothetical protein